MTATSAYLDLMTILRLTLRGTKQFEDRDLLVKELLEKGYELSLKT